MGKKFFDEIELFLFDMDGLLFDTETIYVEYGREVAKEMGYTITNEIIEKTTGLTDERARIIYKEELGQEFPYDEMMGTVKAHIFEKALKGEVPLKSGAEEILKFLSIFCSICGMAYAKNSRFRVRVISGLIWRSDPDAALRGFANNFSPSESLSAFTRSNVLRLIITSPRISILSILPRASIFLGILAISRTPSVTSSPSTPLQRVTP